MVNAVHVANALEHEKNGRTSEAHLDSDFLKTHGILDRVNQWREICECPVQPDDEPAATDKARRPIHSP